MRTAIVETPDGREMELEVPDGATEEQILQFAQKQFSPRSGPNPVAAPPTGRGAGDTSGGAAFGRQATERFLDNATGLIGQIRPPGTALPKLGQLMDVPSGEQAFAGAQAAAEVPGAMMRGEPAQFGQRMDASMAQGQQLEEQHPGPTTLGTIAGDVASLITGRSPFSRAVIGAEKKLATRMLPTDMDPGFRKALNQTLNSKSVRKLARGAGRAAETGIEGAALASVQGGDPHEAFGFAAGGQLVGSGILSGVQETFSRVPGNSIPVKMAVAAAGSTALIQMFKSATPGGQDRILESEESAYKKILWGVGLGALTASAGLGRGRGGELAKNFPKITDSLTAIPRGSMLSVLEESREDERIEPVLSRAAQDSQYFKTKHQRELMKAFQDKKVSLSKTLDRLNKDPDFKARLSTLTQEGGRSSNSETTSE